MADKDKSFRPAAGLDVFADFLVGNKSGGESSASVEEKSNDNYQDIDPDELKDKLDSVDKGDVDKTKKVDTTPKIDDKKDDKVVADIIDEKDDKVDEPVDDEYESEISTFFASQLVKKLGIDETDDLKVKKIDDVLALMGDIIDENSKPTYASEEVEKYDEFVKHGGDLRTFYKEMYANRVNAESVDLENQHDQRAVIRENFLNQGYKEDKIKKMLSRYEENETLKEEAEDALDLVKEYNAKKAESLLMEQKNKDQATKIAQQKFYEDVSSTIKTINSVRGTSLTEKDKREVLQYAFVPEKDGLSKFQKESRDVRNILELAYLLMSKDKKIDNAKKDDTDAYKILREKLKAKGNKTDGDQKSKLTGSSLGDFGKGIIFN